MGCLLETIMELVLGLVWIVIRLTWPGLLFGLAAGALILALPIDNNRWLLATTTFLTCWLGISIALAIRQSKIRARKLRDQISR